MPDTTDSFCYVHHTNETVPEDVYLICGECGHVYTREALEAADADQRGYRVDAEDISFCPECLHDF